MRRGWAKWGRATHTSAAWKPKVKRGRTINNTHHKHTTSLTPPPPPTQQHNNTQQRNSALCDYLFYADGDARRALELAAAASQVAQAAGADDWWWAARLGKAHLRLGLPRDAAQHFEASLQQQVRDLVCSAPPVLPLPAAF